MENLEKKACPWKANSEFQYNQLSEAERLKLKDTVSYMEYERCLGCIGIDETCPKYQGLKKIGYI
jgi:hypothetical protein